MVRTSKPNSVGPKTKSPKAKQNGAAKAGKKVQVAKKKLRRQKSSSGVLKKPKAELVNNAVAAATKLKPMNVLKKQQEAQQPPKPELNGRVKVKLVKKFLTIDASKNKVHKLGDGETSGGMPAKKPEKPMKLESILIKPEAKGEKLLKKKVIKDGVTVMRQELSGRDKMLKSLAVAFPEKKFTRSMAAKLAAAAAPTLKSAEIPKVVAQTSKAVQTKLKMRKLKEMKEMKEMKSQQVVGAAAQKGLSADKSVEKSSTKVDNVAKKKDNVVNGVEATKLMKLENLQKTQKSLPSKIGKKPTVEKKKKDGNLKTLKPRKTLKTIKKPKKVTLAKKKKIKLMNNVPVVFREINDSKKSNQTLKTVRKVNAPKLQAATTSAAAAKKVKKATTTTTNATTTTATAAVERKAGGESRIDIDTDDDYNNNDVVDVDDDDDDDVVVNVDDDDFDFDDNDNAIVNIDDDDIVSIDDDDDDDNDDDVVSVDDDANDDIPTTSAATVSKVKKADKEMTGKFMPTAFDEKTFFNILNLENIKFMCGKLKVLVAHEVSKMPATIFDDYRYIMNITCFKVANSAKRMVKLYLKHSLVDIDKDNVAIIVPDLVLGSKVDYEPTKKYYQDMFKEAGVKGLTIIPFRQLRNEYSSFETLRKFANSYEYFLCDGRIVGHVNGHCGKIFQKTRTTIHAVHLANTKAFKEEIQRVLKKTSYNNFKRGNMISIPVGNHRHSIDVIGENIDYVIKQLKAVYPGGLANIRNIYIKLNINGTSALPLYINMVGAPAQISRPLSTREQRMVKLRTQTGDVLSKFCITKSGEFVKINKMQGKSKGKSKTARKIATNQKSASKNAKSAITK